MGIIKIICNLFCMDLIRRKTIINRRLLVWTYHVASFTGTRYPGIAVASTAAGWLRHLLANLLSSRFTQIGLEITLFGHIRSHHTSTIITIYIYLGCLTGCVMLLRASSVRSSDTILTPDETRRSNPHMVYSASCAPMAP